MEADVIRFQTVRPQLRLLESGAIEKLFDFFRPGDWDEFDVSQNTPSVLRVGSRVWCGMKSTTALMNP